MLRGLPRSLPIPYEENVSLIAPELLRLMKLQLFFGAWTTEDDRTERIRGYLEDKIATEANIKSESSPEPPCPR